MVMTWVIGGAIFVILLVITMFLWMIHRELRKILEIYEVRASEAGEGLPRVLKMVFKKTKAPTDRAKQWINTREFESRR